MDPTPSQHQRTESAPGHPGSDGVSGTAQAPHAAVDLDVARTGGGYRPPGAHRYGPAAAEQQPDQAADTGREYLFDRSSRRMAVVLVGVPLIVLALVVVLLRRPLGW